MEREWSDGAPPVATEITITSRAGGQCVVRMVHSLFSSSDDWDDQLEGFEGGWPGFFEVLRIYLAHFAGMKAASFQAMASVDGDQLASWQRLMKGLDLVGASFGERRTTPSQPERLSGMIEHVLQNSKIRVVMMRLDEPGPGVAMIGAHDAGGRTNLSMCVFCYGDDAAARAAASESKWRAWLAQTFTAGT